DATGVGRLEAGDQIEERRFAGTVWTDDADDLTLVHIERNVGVRSQPAVALGQALHLKQRAHGIPGRRPMRSSNRLRIPLGRHMPTSRIRMPYRIRSIVRPVPPSQILLYSDKGTRIAAPSAGPHTVPLPPRTVMSRTRIEISAENSRSGSRTSTYCA